MKRVARTNRDASRLDRIYKMVAALFPNESSFLEVFGEFSKFASTKRGNALAPKGEMILHQKGKSS